MSDKKKQLPSVGVRIVKAVEQPIKKAEQPTQLDTQEARTAGEFAMPPYPLEGLRELVKNSQILPQCIAAYKNNIAGFGLALRYITDDGEETPEMKAEWDAMQEIVDLLNIDMDTKQVFENVIEAREIYGIAYLEVLRNPAGEVNQISFVRDTPTIRKTYPLDPPVMAEYNYKGQKVIQRPRRFCKYRQEVGGKTVYFKEFGDPRMMDNRNGRYVSTDEEDGEPLPVEFQANEILDFTIGTELYGEVRWIGQILGIDGTRAAESLNNNYFRNGRHTPLLFCVNNGTLTEDSYDNLRRYMDDVKGEAGQHSFLILETEGADNRVDFDEAQTPKVEIKDLASILQKDELFQDYIENSRKRVQSAFQLPDLYVGYSTDFNRATAQTAMEVTEEQVFQPERKSLEWIINNRLLNEYGFKHVEVYFLEPDISNPDDLFKILTIGNTAGGLTPNKARSIIADALGEKAENFPDEWGEIPLAVAARQNQVAAPGPSDIAMPGTVQKAYAGYNDEIVPVLKEMRALLKKSSSEQFTNYNGGIIIKGDEDGWVTINGTKVHFGEDGQIDMGPDGLKAWSGASSGDSSGSSGSGGSKSGAEAEKVCSESAKGWQKNLSADEKASIVEYTGDGYEYINTGIRDGDDDMAEIFEEVTGRDFDSVVGSIDSAISKFELTEDITVVRGLSSENVRRMGYKLDESIVGRSYSDSGFMSTTTDKAQAAKFAQEAVENEGWGKQTILQLDIPAGTGRGAYVASISEHSGEKEFLVRRGAQFEFTSITTQDDGTLVLNARWKE